MGCSLDCALSNLPIEHGGPLRVFILAKTPAHLGRQSYNATKTYTPIGVSLRADHDDYNEIDNAQPSSLFQLTAKHYFPGYDGDAAKLINEIRKGTINTLKRDDQEFGKKAFDLEIAYVREDVYQSLIKMHYNFSYSDPKVQTDFHFQNLDIVKDLRVIKDLYKNHLSRIQAIKQSSTQTEALKESLIKLERHHFETEFPQTFRTAIEDRDYDHLSSFLAFAVIRAGSFFEAFHMPYLQFFLDRLDQEKAISQDIIEDTRELMTHFHLNNHVLQGLSKSWLPSTEIVGNDKPFLLHEAFANAVAEISKAELESISQEDNGSEWYKHYKSRQPRLRAPTPKSPLKRRK